MRIHEEPLRVDKLIIQTTDKRKLDYSTMNTDYISFYVKGIYMYVHLITQISNKDMEKTYYKTDVIPIPIKYITSYSYLTSDID